MDVTITGTLKVVESTSSNKALESLTTLIEDVTEYLSTTFEIAESTVGLSLPLSQISPTQMLYLKVDNDLDVTIDGADTAITVTDKLLIIGSITSVSVTNQSSEDVVNLTIVAAA